jgi:hypothetical protein
MNDALRPWGVQLEPVNEPEMPIEAGVLDRVDELVEDGHRRHRDEVVSNIQHRGEQTIAMYRVIYDHRDVMNEALGSYRARIIDMRLKIINAIREADAGVRPYSDVELIEPGHAHYGVSTVADVVNDAFEILLREF